MYKQTPLMKIDKTLLANINDPHYFIFKNYVPWITVDADEIEFLPFKDAGEAKKYAKSVGKHFEFATKSSYSIIEKNNLK